MTDGRWATYAAIFGDRTGGASDTDSDWKDLLRATGPLALARTLGIPIERGDRWGPCPSCGASRSSSDARPVLYEFISDRDDTRLWRCRVCRRIGHAVGYAALAARGREARTADEWRDVRRWLAERGVVAPDPFDTSAPPVTVQRRELARASEGPAAVLPPADEVAAFWSSCVRLDAGPLPVSRAPSVHADVDRYLVGLAARVELGADAVIKGAAGMVRALPGGGPWPVWCPVDLAIDRRFVVPAYDAAGALRTLRFIRTAEPRLRPAPGLAGVTASATLAESALAAARDGFRVVPLYGVTDGRCTCPDGAECGRPGKHPAIRDWPELATADEVELGGWWARRPALNVGIATGDGLVVMDVDGPTGEASLAALVERYGPLPVTFEVRSGRVGGGRHLYLSCPGWTCPTSYSTGRAKLPGGDHLGAGLDVRGDGGNGLVVAPGSRHASGAVYSVTVPVPVAVAPRWLLDLVGRETDADPPGFDAAGLVYASPGALTWLRGLRPAPRAVGVVVGAAGDWLTHAVRHPSAAVLGVWAPSCWSRELSARVPDRAEVVVVGGGAVERIRSLSGGRFTVREVPRV